MSLKELSNEEVEVLRANMKMSLIELSKNYNISNEELLVFLLEISCELGMVLGISKLGFAGLVDELMKDYKTVDKSAYEELLNVFKKLTNE